MTTSVNKSRNYPLNFIATGLVAALALTGCGGDGETVTTVVEAEKSPQAPLIFTFSEQSYYIDEQPQLQTLSGGSGSGAISFSVSDSGLASVDTASGELTFLDDGTFIVTATKAGDDVYQATSASFQLTVNKYNRKEYQILSFLAEELRVALESGVSEGNVFLPAADSPNATSVVEVDFNLPADATVLDPRLFDPNNSITFNASFSISIYDSLGEFHLQTFYFIKDRAVSNDASSRDEWYLVTSVNDVFVDFANADGGVPDNSAANLVGEISGISGISGLDGVTAARLSFNDSGDFVGLFAADNAEPEAGQLQTVPLTSEIITTGAALMQSLKLDLFLDKNGFDRREPTQFDAPFTISRLEQDGYRIGWLTDDVLSYESANTDIATVDDLGGLSLIAAGETTITVTIAEDERFTETSVSYQLVVE